MAHLLASNPVKTSVKLVYSESKHNVRRKSGRFGKAQSGSFVFKCCSSTSGSASLSVVAEEKVRVQQIDDKGSGKQEAAISNIVFGGKQVELEYLACEYEWRVRRLIEKADEIRKAAQVQAEAFHVPVALFDDLFFQFFQAEVLSGLLYKLNNSPPNRYACLVAEPATNDSYSQEQLVGVVDVTALRDKNVLQHLPTDAEEYLYISGIAVNKNFRRRKVATTLLKACDVLSILWGFEFLALRAYEDDLGARKLYANAGYQVVSRDPPWMSTWIGRKCRVLMIKRANLPM